MARDTDGSIAHRIAQIAQKQPDRSRLAFDADGKLIDWQNDGSDVWQNSSHDGERIFVVPGGADEAQVRQSLDEG